jgi:DNA-binding MarR family transcriptional regulator
MIRQAEAERMTALKKKTGFDRKRSVLPRHSKEFVPPATITLPAMLKSGGDVGFRETLYLMALTFGRLYTCREAFGRALDLTASQFIVLIGTAYQQGSEGVSIRALADHTQLAATHVTTEVGRLIDKGLLTKQASTRDRRSVLVRLRRVNDLLFADISREDFTVVSRFLEKFALNSEYALAEIRRADRERAKGTRSPRAGQD